jgi:CheY-like chemotaxis protein
MAVMDGLCATQAIREHERQDGLARIPILMLTANALPEARGGCSRRSARR